MSEAPAAAPIQWSVAGLVTVAAFMEVLDSTIVIVSQPYFAGSLSVSYDQSTWVLTSYLVANGIVLTISGWLSRFFGRKNYFLLCLGMFTVMSFLCGMSQNMTELVTFRFFQGLFGGGLQPTQQAILLDCFPPERRAMGFALAGIASVMGPVLGPTLGGLITENYSWRWIFFINVPVGILGSLAIAMTLRDPPWARREKSQFDFIGLTLIALALGSLQVIADRGETDGWLNSPFIQALLMLFFVASVGAVGWLLTARHPIVNLRVFADRNFMVGTVGIGLVGFQLYSGSVLSSGFSENVIGYTSLTAGLILGPASIILVIMMPVVGQLMKWFSPRYLASIGFTASGFAGLYTSHHITSDIGYGTLVMLRVMQASGFALMFVPLTTIAYSTLPSRQRGDATSLYSMARNIMGSNGISAVTILLAQRAQLHQAYAVEHLAAGHTPFDQLVRHDQLRLQALGHGPAEAHGLALGRILSVLRVQVQALAYGDAFAFVGVAALIAVPFILVMTRSVKTQKASGGAS